MGHFEALKTEEVIFTVGSGDSYKNPDIAFRKPSRSPVKPLSEEYNEDRKRESGLPWTSPDWLWEQLQNQMLSRIQRVRYFNARAVKNYTEGMYSEPRMPTPLTSC
ncbi:uncharacterized protein RSE6_02506 [Rhynchosporium secalis]|uniref:Uncharacterized protein n=1 Tax=Rhynchosporium secalis TaxID=38038 RepID=A0A1E1M0D6_RHYSE|nr:uncharacterized protein RSE6_02506 [Rhynchosporium secalis]